MAPRELGHDRLVAGHLPQERQAFGRPGASPSRRVRGRDSRACPARGGPRTRRTRPSSARWTSPRRRAAAAGSRPAVRTCTRPSGPRSGSSSGLQHRTQRRRAHRRARRRAHEHVPVVAHVDRPPGLRRDQQLGATERLVGQHRRDRHAPAAGEAELAADADAPQRRRGRAQHPRAVRGSPPRAGARSCPGTPRTTADRPRSCRRGCGTGPACARRRRPARRSDPVSHAWSSATVATGPRHRQLPDPVVEPAGAGRPAPRPGTSAAPAGQGARGELEAAPPGIGRAALERDRDDRAEHDARDRGRDRPDRPSSRAPGPAHGQRVGDREQLGARQVRLEHDRGRSRRRSSGAGRVGRRRPRSGRPLRTPARRAPRRVRRRAAPGQRSVTRRKSSPSA